MKDLPPHLDPEKIVPISRSSTEAFKTGSWSSRQPVHIEKVSPCRMTCPAGNNIPRALLKAAQGDVDGALAVFLTETPLPGVCGSICYHPCEGACNRGQWDEAVSIRSLERAASDYGNASPEILTQKGNGFPVAVVGSGPAGLSAAYHLARMGHTVTMLESQDEPGGLLRWGIPEFRLSPSVLQRDLSRIFSLGIELRTKTPVNSRQLEQLQREYGAVFMGTGAWESCSLEIPGIYKPNLLSGLDFLGAVRRGALNFIGPNVLVIGGGNVALDAALTALRLGADRVELVCLEQRADMPAHDEEYEIAATEGVFFNHGWSPKGLQLDNDRWHVDFVKCTAVCDETGCFNPQCDDSITMTSEADWIITAVGQRPDLTFLQEFEIAKQADSIFIDGTTMQTSRERIFAGGDAARMPGSVVDAIAAGKRAAVSIHMKLCGLEQTTGMHMSLGGSSSFSIEALFRPPRAWDPASVVHFENLEPLFLDHKPRTAQKKLQVDERRHNFKQIILPLNKDSAITEASRCFYCGTCSACDRCLLFCPEICIAGGAQGGYHADSDYCKGCAVCAAVCPRGVMEMGEKK